MNDQPDQLTLLDLPDIELGCIFSCLTSHQDLVAVELLCRRTRDLVDAQQLWSKACIRAQPTLSFTAIDISHLANKFKSREGTRRMPVVFKKLLFCLVQPPEYPHVSLIHKALAASSMDQPQEHVHEVLHPVVKSRNRPGRYWCSAGRADKRSGESLAFQLVSPLCIVTELQIRFFRAWFQEDTPLYAPQSLRISFGAFLTPDVSQRDLRADFEAAATEMLAGPAANEGQQAQHAGTNDPRWRWTSPWYDVAPDDDSLQRFPIPPTLCYGGYVRIDLRGRTTQQSTDNLYYTCVGYVKLKGRSPIFDFDPVLTYPTTNPHIFACGDRQEPGAPARCLRFLSHSSGDVEGAMLEDMYPEKLHLSLHLLRASVYRFASDLGFPAHVYDNIETEFMMAQVLDQQGFFELFLEGQCGVQEGRAMGSATESDAESENFHIPDVDEFGAGLAVDLGAEFVHQFLEDNSSEEEEEDQ